MFWWAYTCINWNIITNVDIIYWYHYCIKTNFLSKVSEYDDIYTVDNRSDKVLYYLTKYASRNEKSDDVQIVQWLIRSNDAQLACWDCDIMDVKSIKWKIFENCCIKESVNEHQID